MPRLSRRFGQLFRSLRGVFVIKCAGHLLEIILDSGPPWATTLTTQSRTITIFSRGFTPPLLSLDCTHCCTYGGGHVCPPGARARHPPTQPPLRLAAQGRDPSTTRRGTSTAAQIALDVNIPRPPHAVYTGSTWHHNIHATGRVTQWPAPVAVTRWRRPTPQPHRTREPGRRAHDLPHPKLPAPGPRSARRVSSSNDTPLATTQPMMGPTYPGRHGQRL